MYSYMSFDRCTHPWNQQHNPRAEHFLLLQQMLAVPSHSFLLFLFQTTIGLFSVNIKECVFMQTDYIAHALSCLVLFIWNNEFWDSCMWLHASVVSSFQVVMILFLIQHLLMDMRVISSFDLLWLNLLWTCMYKFFRYLFSLSLG